MTAAQTSIPFKGSHRLSGPLAIVAAGLIVAVVGVAISARPVAAPASITSVNSAPLTLGHDEHAVSVNLVPLTFGHDEHAVSVNLVPLTLGHDEHAAGGASAPLLTSGHDEHPTAPKLPRRTTRTGPN